MLNCKSVLCWFSPFCLVYVVKKCGVMGVLGSQPQEAMPWGSGADSERHTPRMLQWHGKLWLGTKQPLYKPPNYPVIINLSSVTNKFSAVSSRVIVHLTRIDQLPLKWHAHVLFHYPWSVSNLFVVYYKIHSMDGTIYEHIRSRVCLLT